MASRQDGVEGPGGVGARLKSARERAGLSAVQAAEKLHVDTVLLQALEADRFDALGPPVYVRGYIRHYADLVRESPEELESLYGASGHAARQPDLTHIPRPAPERFSSKLLVPGIVIVAAIALIGISWWIAGELHRTSKAREITAASVVLSAPPGGALAARPAPERSADPPARAPLR